MLHKLRLVILKSVMMSLQCKVYEQSGNLRVWPEGLVGETRLCIFSGLQNNEVTRKSEFFSVCVFGEQFPLV